MRIVNPSFGIPQDSDSSAAAADRRAAPKVDWKRDSMVLFSNSKPNSKELLEGIRTKLSALRPVDDVDYLYHSNVSHAAPAEMIDEIARKYRIALLAVGD